MQLNPRAIKTIALLVLLAAVLGVILVRILRGREPSERRPQQEPVPPPDCTRCGLKLMQQRTSDGRLRFTCPACQVDFVARNVTTDVQDYPDAFDQETRTPSEDDPTTDSTMFGM